MEVTENLLEGDKIQTDLSISQEEVYVKREDCNCKLISNQSEETGIVYCSQQSTKYENILIKLERDLEITKKHSKRNESVVSERANKLVAFIEIIKHIDLNGGFIPFEDAFEIFISHQSGLPDKRSFRNSILDIRDGIPVHVFQINAGKSSVRYIVKKSEDFFLDKFLDHFREKENIPHCSSRYAIHKTVFTDIVNSIDTEWDRKCVKVLFGCNLSRTEMVRFGLKLDTILKDIEDIKNVISESKNAGIAAEDLFRLRTEASFIKIQTRIDENQSFIDRNKEVLSVKRMEENLKKVDVLNNSRQSLEKLLIGQDKDSVTRRKSAVKRIKRSLIESNRLKKRKLGAGAHCKMDSDDETYVTECLEDMASTDGRRHESVMYLANRIKQLDLLSVANHSRIKRGKALIKSVTTVLNRGRPKNIRSHQAKCHSVGKWLFCTKKPPKTAFQYRIHTRHQRQARKLAKLDAWSSERANWNKLYLVISKDDKAYLRPGTSVGADGLRCKVMYMSTDNEKQPSLPQHDWAEKRLYTTPSAHRFMRKIGTENFIDGDEELVTKEDASVVTVRPKYYVGSSGSIWASDYMLIRFERPDLYEIQDDNYQPFSLPTRKIFAHIIDAVKYFMQTNVKSGIVKVTKQDHCAFRKYEKLRVYSLQKQICLANDKIIDSYEKVTSEERNILVFLEQHVRRLKELLLGLSDTLSQKRVIKDALVGSFQTIFCKVLNSIDFLLYVQE